MDGWTDGRTDRWTDRFSLCSIRLCPLCCRCPAPPQLKSHITQIGHGYRWPVTTNCHWAAIAISGNGKKQQSTNLIICDLAFALKPLAVDNVPSIFLACLRHNSSAVDNVPSNIDFCGTCICPKGPRRPPSVFYVSSFWISSTIDLPFSVFLSLS